ncbi:site-2 protease family protein [Lutimaribacter saemankumensis]|uniref:Zinc metalloprotease n=1 Tax=Lutimaribacter saemankumensis TaxID=490829 RepID=A0A1G8M8N7_9RHOB|nr:site-2 protease family protein [Lutimaribacter saemankumensis]SDI64326.1 Zn-dependent protease (includes SpoIVFB) [Lutimaribacter saemankumensis]
MHWSFPIGTIRGTEIRIHATFFLLLAWVLVAAWGAEGPAAALENVAFILALFTCVVLHEFGHVTMARRFGVKTPDITLLPIGGMARLERIPEDPRQEILVALAGPAVNVVIWLVLTVVLGASMQLNVLQSLEDPTQGFLQRLAAVNLMLVLFNMIPSFPMDGGRVFRAVLALFMDRVRATQIAAQVGQAMAFLFGFLGLTGGSPLLVLIAVFIFFAAGAESSDAALRGRAHDARARDAMITQFEALSPGDTLDTAAAAVLRTTQAEFPVIDADGHLQGILTRNAIIAAIQNDHRADPVSGAMTQDIPALRLDAPMDDVLDAMQSGMPGVAVTDAKGHFLGYITRENVGEWFILSRR